MQPETSANVKKTYAVNPALETNGVMEDGVRLQDNSAASEVDEHEAQMLADEAVVAWTREAQLATQRAMQSEATAAAKVAAKLAAWEAAERIVNTTAVAAGSGIFSSSMRWCAGALAARRPAVARLVGVVALRRGGVAPPERQQRVRPSEQRLAAHRDADVGGHACAPLRCDG